MRTPLHQMNTNTGCAIYNRVCLYDLRPLLLHPPVRPGKENLQDNLQWTDRLCAGNSYSDAHGHWHWSRQDFICRGYGQPALVLCRFPAYPRTHNGTGEGAATILSVHTAGSEADAGEDANHSAKDSFQSKWQHRLRTGIIFARHLGSQCPLWPCGGK